MSGVRFPDHFSEDGFKLTYDHFLNDDFGYCPDCHLQIRRSEWNMKWNPYEYHKHYKPHCPWIQKEEANTAAQKAHKAEIKAKEEAHIRAKQVYQATKAEMAAQAKAKKKARIKSETQARQARMYAEQEARNAELKAKEKARLQAEEAARLEAFPCRRCPAKFASNTKLHEHVRDHHTKSAPPASLKLSLSSIKNTETPPIKLAPASEAASPKLSLSAITSIQIAPASPTPKAAPTSKAAATPKAAPSSKPAPPLTPPATPPKTWAAVASKPTKSAPQSTSKSASKPASAASPLTSPPTPAQTSPQPLKPYLTVHDLYRMFHVKQPPHQTRITLFFKPVIEPARNSKRKTHPISKSTTKSLASPLASPAASKREEIATSKLRKLTSWSFQRYVSGLPLKMAPEKRFENTTHTAPSTNGTTTPTCPNYYGALIKTSAPRRRRLRESRR